MLFFAIFFRALKILVTGLQRRENVFVARVINNLGLLYKDMGKYDLAERKFEECVDIWKKCDHPDVAQPLVNLANLYKEKRRCAFLFPPPPQIAKFKIKRVSMTTDMYKQLCCTMRHSMGVSAVVTRCRWE